MRSQWRSWGVIHPGHIEGGAGRGQTRPWSTWRIPEGLAALIEHALLDHLVGTDAQRWRDDEPQRRRGSLIDDESECRRFLDRQISRLGPFQDSVDVGGGVPVVIARVDRIRSEEHTLNSSHLGSSYAVFCLKKKNDHGYHVFRLSRLGRA